MATAHFERPVDTNHFPDYLDFVENPMDLETVDRKIEQDAYITPEGRSLNQDKSMPCVHPMYKSTCREPHQHSLSFTLVDFEYDVSLIFKNCERYNAPKNNVHMVALGKFASKTFR